MCAGCDAPLTTPLSQVALPVHAHQKYGNAIQLPVLMEPGTFAVETEPWGPPWRRWEEVGSEEAALRGVLAPVHALSYGASGAIVVAPGDTRGTVLFPERLGGACCGLDGREGPNAACEACGSLVATRIDDCSLWQATWLAPDAVRRCPVDGGGDTDVMPLSWAELVAEGSATPPFEPVATWGGSRLGSSHFWSWSPRWVAAAGQALAHLLAASEGRPVTVPDGLVADLFRRALDTLLPTGPSARRAVLAGPELPAPDTGTGSDAHAHADILLVPTHPQTGETWAPADPTTSAYWVPLPFGVWLSLVFPEPYPPVLASGVIPLDVLRDDPLAPLPPQPFRADPRVFHRTMARLPAVRSPWLREILKQNSLTHLL